MRNTAITILAGLLCFLGLTACIEDGYVSDASKQPAFSVDTLHMGTFFTQDVTPTYRFVVYNRHDKILSIDRIAFRDGGTGYFRANVDGLSGKEFAAVDIRPNDSIFVFIEATLPEVGGSLAADYLDYLEFTTMGVTQTVVIEAQGQDVDRRHGVVIDTDTRLEAGLPYQIFDSLVVRPGATLTLDAGVRLHFHDKAFLKVEGTLVTLGTPDAVVEMMGDRTDNVVGSIPFDLMASQWEGVYFCPGSTGNHLSHTIIRNTCWGVVADSLGGTASQPALYMLNCRLRNSAGYALEAHHSAVTAVGCEIADASAGCMYLRGGRLTFNHCTVANYYLFTALGGPSIQFVHFNAETDDGSGMPHMSADFANCIVYGNGTDLSCGDFTGADVMLRRCLLKSAGSDDANFILCLWDTDPLYYTVREDYLFDYRLKDDSPAIGAGDASLTRTDAATDYYGLRRGSSPDLGAYVYTPAK